MPKRSEKDPTKPKGRTSAYAFFVQDLKETQPDKKLDFQAFSKHCSDMWKQISKEDKDRFTKLSEEDKARYDREMAKYRAREGGAAEGGRKKKKDSSLPKRNLSAFMFFSGEQRPKIRAANPKDSLGDVAKKLGAMWKDMSAEQKKPYEKMAAKDKERYLDQVRQLKEDGAISSGGSKKQNKKKQVVIEEEDEDEDEEEDEEEDEDSSD